MLLEGYRLLGGAHSETSAARDMLAFHGINAPHTGAPFSEAMLLGIGGGIGGGYWVFEFEGIPPAMALGARHNWQLSPGLFIAAICEHLGVPVTVRETAGRKAAEAHLFDALRANRPAAVAVDMASVQHLQLPQHLIKCMYHLIVVCGLDEEAGIVAVDDRAREPFTMPLTELADARQAITSMKHRLVTIEPGSVDVDLARAIAIGIRTCVEGLLHPPIRNFGIAAWEKWAGLVANPKDKKGWPNVFAPGRNLYNGLLGVYQSIEAGGNGQGMLRGLFADFLEESAGVVQRPELVEQAAIWRDIAGRWTALAEAALPAGVTVLAEVRTLLHDREQRFLAAGRQASDAIRAIDERLIEIQTEMETNFPLDQAQPMTLLQELRDRLLDIHAAEHAAATALAG